MADTINIWSRVGVDVSTLLAAAKTITGISAANPGVVTSAAHGFADGDIVLLTVSGMEDLDGRVVRVAEADTNDFELEGIDTSTYGLFTAGTAQKITFGASASTFVDVNASGGNASKIPVGTIHTKRQRNIPGVKEPLVYSFSSLWKPSDPALQELAKADDTQTVRAMQIRFATGARVYFAAYPSCHLAPTGTSGQAAQTPVELDLIGPVTAYAS